MSKAERARDEDDDYRRPVSTKLGFWRACGEKRCRRARACAGDAHACFERHWHVVPAEFKARLYAMLKAMEAGLSLQEATRAVEAEIALVKSIEAKLDAATRETA